MILLSKINLWSKTAVFLLTFLFFTACSVPEARPTIIPIVLTPTPEVTAVPPTTLPSTAIATAVIQDVTPTQTASLPLLPEPTAIPPQFITPTQSRNPSYHRLE